MIPDQTPYYGPLYSPAPHCIELNLITQSMFTRTVRNMRFYDAITTIFLAAEIHGTDRAVLNAMWKVLPRIQTDKQPIILAMMSAKSPLAHISKVLTTIPKEFFEAEIKKLSLTELQAVIGVNPELSTTDAQEALPLEKAA